MIFVTLTFCFLIACQPVTSAAIEEIVEGENLKEIGSYGKIGNRQADRTLDISYHGGPIMEDPVVYVIFYGNWSTVDQNNVINFVTNVGNTSWWKINRAYGVCSLTYGGSFVDKKYSNGKNLTDTLVFSILVNAFILNAFPINKNGIYLILTSSDVVKDGFCDKYCGRHYYDGANNIKYAFAGVPKFPKCNWCTQQQTVSPNGNPAVDGLINVVAHELTEAATDPSFQAWYDVNGDENADKCLNNYIGATKLPNGALSNLVVNGKNYLIQSNWNVLTQSCAMKLL